MSATFRAKILRSQAACSAGVLPRNWSRFLESLHERLLHDVGWVNPSGRARTKLQTCQKPQILAKPLETTRVWKIHSLHLGPLTIESTGAVSAFSRSVPLPPSWTGIAFGSRAQRGSCRLATSPKTTTLYDLTIDQITLDSLRRHVIS